MKRYSIVLFLLSIVILSCGRFNNNRKENNSKVRIVSVSKQLTEFLFALQQGDKVVGVDLSSTYPSEATKLPTVGYHRLLSTEGIISLEPTLAAHQGDVAPPSVMPQLQKVGIPIKVYPQGNTIDSAKIVLQIVAKDYGAEAIAAQLNNKLDADLKRADSAVKQYKTKPRVLIIHFGQQMNQYFVMGTRGTGDKMISLAGGINAADTTGFRNLSPEIIVKEQPDVILATDFGFDRAGGMEKFIQLPGIGLTPAAKNKKIYRIEEHDLLYFGPRSGETIMHIAELIHR